MAKKIKKFKVGMDSETYAISLVEAGAIESDFVALSKEEEEKVQVLLETNEKHMVYGAALIPDKDIYRNNGEQEYYINFSKESIEKMSQEFMKEYRQHEVTTDHEDIANEVCVVESWLVSDAYKDKANALGINVPEGTWMIGMKVNNIETWDRIKNHELNGFSVESVVSLEEFEKQNNNNMEIEANEMFWTKLVNVLKETFSKKDGEIEPVNEIDLAKQSGFTNVEDYKKEVEAIKEELEEQNPVNGVNSSTASAPTPEPVSEPSEPVAEPEPTVTPEPTPEPVTEPQNEPVEAPKNDNAHLEELINNLKSEIEALKGYNSELQNKVKDMEKQPSTQPVNVNAKPSAGDSYAAWREQLRGMIG